MSYQRRIFWAGCSAVGLALMRPKFFQSRTQSPYINTSTDFHPIDNSKWDTDRPDILMDSFERNKIPQEVDYIVIGSGISGLTAAGYLARVGNRVLVLEQLDRAGGCMHEFSEYDFDVGIHYVGNVAKHTRFLEVLLDPDRPVEWAQMGSKDNGWTYDRFVFGDDFQFDVRAGSFSEDLKQVFTAPADHKGIDLWFSKLARAKKAMKFSIGSRLTTSKWWSWIALKTGSILYRDVWNKTVTDILNECAAHNRKLELVLSGNMGDIGGLEKDTSFLLMAELQQHYADGAYYPIGGPAGIARSLVSAIEKRGGRCLVSASVESVLFDNDNRAIGVTVQTSNFEDDLVTVNCRKGVISSAGFVNTWTKLVPIQNESISKMMPEVELKIRQKILDLIPPSSQHFHVYVALNGTGKELGLPNYNYWVYNMADNGPELEDYDTYVSAFHDDPIHSQRIMGLLSFPSSKDPTYSDDDRHLNKSICSVVTEIPFEFWKKWNGTQTGCRGEEYKSLKEEAARYILDNTLFKFFPHTRGRVEMMDSGTALTAQHFLGRTVGESYGMSFPPDRYCDFECVQALKPHTPLANFWMTGQDIVTCGFAGSLAAGYHTASAVLGYYDGLGVLRGSILLKDVLKLEPDIDAPENTEMKSKEICATTRQNWQS